MKKVLFAVLLLCSFMLAQNKVNYIKITDPSRDGIDVKSSYDIKGKAQIESGTYLWALVHRIKGFKKMWWPQGECEIDPKSKEWEITVHFGNANDIGFEFEIAIININQKEHKNLEAYWSKAMQTGNWYPIKMPPAIIAPQYIKVIKSSDN
jgi:hypothetical protein